jgi:NAD(P)-dependent dehydrogenase (short-subunit alcohol dehydrogenase family)
MVQRFLGKRVLVTGSGSGIGLATALMFHEEGADVVGLDLKEQPHPEFKGSHYACDVSDPEMVQSVLERVMQDGDRLDAMILSAGINGPMGRIEHISPVDFRRLYEINVFGVFNFLHFGLKYLEATQGSVTLLGSINGSRSFKWAGASPYVSSKSAIVGLGRNLATEFGPRGVRINTVCPGSTTTNIQDSTDWRGDWPVGRRIKYPDGSMPLTGEENATPEDVARAILFLSSDDAKHITGTELFVDAGQSLI